MFTRQEMSQHIFSATRPTVYIFRFIQMSMTSSTRLSSAGSQLIMWWFYLLSCDTDRFTGKMSQCLAADGVNFLPRSFLSGPRLELRPKPVSVSIHMTD